MHNTMLQEYNKETLLDLIIQLTNSNDLDDALHAIQTSEPDNVADKAEVSTGSVTQDKRDCEEDYYDVSNNLETDGDDTNEKL